MIKKLLGNSAIYGIAPYIPKVVSIFLLPLLTEHLTDVDYGIAGTISAYTLALSAFSTLGVSAVLQTTFFKATNHYKILWRQVYGFLQIWMIVFAVIQGVLLYFMIPQEAIENRWAIIILSNFNTVFFGPAAFLAPLYYQLSQKPIPVAIRSVLTGLLTILVNYILIVVFNFGYMGWYVGSFLGTFFINITYWYSLNKRVGITPIYKFKKRTIKNTLKVSIPMIPHYYSVFMINSFNRVVMDQGAVPIGKIGEYNMAQQFSSIVESGISAIEKAITPMCMQGLRNDNERMVKQLIYIFVLITFNVTFMFTIWSKEIFKLFVNNEILVNAYPIASMLVLALNYRPIYIAATNVYFYNLKTKEILYITFGAGMIAVIGNIIFIPRYGIIGASIVTFVAYLYQGYIGFFSKTFKKYSKSSYPILTIFLIQVLLTVLGLLNIDSSIEVKVLLMVAIVIADTFLIRKIFSKS